MRVRLILSLSGLTLVSLAGTASAHVDLMMPPPRVHGEAGGNQLKKGPCGQDTNARSANVTTYMPGQTIEIKFKEYVSHPGYFSVAFDPDGDNDFPFPRANMDDVVPASDDPKALFPISATVLGHHLDEKDPGGDCYNAPERTCSLMVKLPNIQCANCTLQVTQFMYDKVNNNNPDEYYYQCADIKLEGPLQGGGGTGGTGGSGGSGGVAMGGVGGAAGGVPASGGVAGTTPIGGVSNGGATTAAGGMRTVPAAPADDSGCSVNATTGQSGGSGTGALLASALLLGLGLLRGRRSSGGDVDRA